MKISENPFVIPVPPNLYGKLKLASNEPATGIERADVQSA